MLKANLFDFKKIVVAVDAELFGKACGLSVMIPFYELDLKVGISCSKLLEGLHFLIDPCMDKIAHDDDLGCAVMCNQRGQSVKIGG